MTKVQDKKNKKDARHKRIRAKIKGTKTRPRLSIFKSNKNICAQLIDDTTGAVLVFVLYPGKNIKAAYSAGELLAKKSLEKKIKQTVFDRGGYKFHGTILALADGAKKGGLEF